MNYYNFSNTKQTICYAKDPKKSESCKYFWSENTKSDPNIRWWVNNRKADKFEIYLFLFQTLVEIWITNKRNHENKQSYTMLSNYLLRVAPIKLITEKCSTY